MIIGRFARAGAVGFVVVWATATLAMTAASLGGRDRPELQPDAIEAEIDAVDVQSEGDAAPTPTIRPATPTVAPETTSDSPITPPTPPVPEHLVAPSPTDRVVVTEVLPSVATRPEASSAQPDFTG